MERCGTIVRRRDPAGTRGAADCPRSKRRARPDLGGLPEQLENGGVKKPSPHVLHQLSEALTVPYAELIRLSGYRLPGEAAGLATETVGSALFADLTDDERDELLEYLAWYRTRKRSNRGGNGAG